MSDYDRIAQAINFITSHVTHQPDMKEIAAHLHLSPSHFQRVFCRWAGVTPKRFLQALTVERAKQLLVESRPLLEVSDRVGLSSASRLYDHFIQLEAVTPGEFKQGGAGLTILHAVHDTPFGKAFIAVTVRGVCNFAFLDDNKDDDHLSVLAGSWPHADLQADQERTGALVRAMFGMGTKPDRPLSLYVSGTNFQVNVWKALLKIPPASVASYSQIADAIGHPGAARAVGSAAAANPVAFLIPCHRVLQQGGKLGGYHWGTTRKHAIHAWESARFG
ncbi:MAG: methylated-DNA--[protein]-cysteine S-methyltransferase [Betaproteobacteria bacterium]|nr:methylated-DNA--[protein]-cysteine S-methyltransferase [Betaproteobacteria bacterium]